MPTKYKIDQDRWCWCGHPAALLVSRGKLVMAYVCSERHGEDSIKWFHEEEERSGVKPDSKL